MNVDELGCRGMHSAEDFLVLKCNCFSVTSSLCCCRCSGESCCLTIDVFEISDWR